MSAFESVSTWRQPLPDNASPERQALVDLLARRIVALGPSRIRVAIDGHTASGKTTFGHELAAAVRALGRPTLRASLDDFKRPWRDAIDKGYDRVSGDGYYRNAPDFESTRELLLRPAGADGNGSVVLCAYDPLTGIDHRDIVVDAPRDAVLIVDSVFALRPEYIEFWDFTIWLDIDDELSRIRGVNRDAAMEGSDAAERVHRDRYRVAEQMYTTEVDPVALVDVVVDNTSFSHPRIVPPAGGSTGRRVGRCRALDVAPSLVENADGGSLNRVLGSALRLAWVQARGAWRPESAARPQRPGRRRPGSRRAMASAAAARRAAPADVTEQCPATTP